MAYTVTQAKNNLSRLLKEVEEGKEVIVMRRGKPVAKLIPVENATAVVKYRRMGGFEGLIQLDDSALDPLTDEEMIEYGFDNPEKDARLRAAMGAGVNSTDSIKSTE